MYETFYDLTDNPFQLTPDPAFYFSSKGHKRAMAYMQYGLHKAEGFVVVTGEVGSGKTTLVRHLLAEMDDEAIVAIQLPLAGMDATQLLFEIARELDLSPVGKDKPALLADIRKRLDDIHDAGQRAVLIVDEAQSLSRSAVEELRLLTDYAIASRPVVQVFLIGQTALYEALRRPDMVHVRQRTVGSYHVGPLEKDDTRAYIEHRLGCVNWDNDPSFDDDAIALIHEQAQGLPRRINVLCDKVLLAACLAEAEEVTSQMVREVIADINQEPVNPLAMMPTPDYAAADNAGAGQEVVDLALTDEADLPLESGPLNRMALEKRISALEASNVLVVESLRRLLTEVQSDESASLGRTGDDRPLSH